MSLRSLIAEDAYSLDCPQCDRATVYYDNEDELACCLYCGVYFSPYTPAVTSERNNNDDSRSEE